MTTFQLIPFFMIGLLGSVHCLGMCGGIVGAISSATSNRSNSSTRFPIPIVARTAQDSPTLLPNLFLRTISYNVGRISSYCLAGALVGGTSQGIRALVGLTPIQLGGFWLVNIMLMALGLYLMGLLPSLAYLEYAGTGLWRTLQPLLKKLFPLDSPFKLVLAGAVWGWLPCGMVYSMLLTAMFSGSTSSGVLVMLSFGLGTMPMLMAMGLLGAKLNAWRQYASVRVLCGVIVFGFGLVGLFRATSGLPMSLLDSFCIN